MQQFRLKGVLKKRKSVTWAEEVKQASVDESGRLIEMKPTAMSDKPCLLGEKRTMPRVEISEKAQNAAELEVESMKKQIEYYKRIADEAKDEALGLEIRLVQTQTELDALKQQILEEQQQQNSEETVPEDAPEVSELSDDEAAPEEAPFAFLTCARCRGNAGVIKMHCCTATICNECCDGVLEDRCCGAEGCFKSFEDDDDYEAAAAHLNAQRAQASEEGDDAAIPFLAAAVVVAEVVTETVDDEEEEGEEEEVPAAVTFVVDDDVIAAPAAVEGESSEEHQEFTAADAAVTRWVDQEEEAPALAAAVVEVAEKEKRSPIADDRVAVKLALFAAVSSMRKRTTAPLDHAVAAKDRLRRRLLSRNNKILRRGQNRHCGSVSRGFSTGRRR